METILSKHALTTLVSLLKFSSLSEAHENKFKGPSWT